MISKNAAAMFDEALRSAGIPIHGVSVLNSDGDTSGYPSEWHLVVRADGLVVRVDYDNATAEQIAEGDDIVLNLDVTATRPRSVWAIFDDIMALTQIQRDNIRHDIRPNDYEKIKTLTTPQDGPALVLHWCVTSLAGTTETEKHNAIFRMAAMYSQAHPDYLVNPPFDPSINIPGDEPA